jgi:hypothetical protein
MNDEEHKTLAKLEYSIDEDGEIYIDILIEDYSDETLIQFARLLSSIPTSKFQLQTLGIAQEAFSKDGRLEELKILVSEIVKLQGFNKILDYLETKDTTINEEKDNPLIKPSDLM